MPLVDDIELRVRDDRFRARRNFFIAQSIIWLAVASSFGSSIAAALGVEAWVVAVFAAIPAAVILIDRSFSFGARARWHYMLSTELAALARALKYEGASDKEVSRQFSDLLKAAEKGYPALDTAGINQPTDANRHDENP